MITPDKTGDTVGTSKKTKLLSVRIPYKEFSVIESYAVAHDISRAQALLHFLREGIAAEAGDKPATKSDLIALATTLQKAIKSQPIAVQKIEDQKPKELQSSEEYERTLFGLYRKKRK